MFCYPLQGVKTLCPVKLTSQGFGSFFKKNIFQPWLPQLLQSCGLKYTYLKRYALFPHFAEAASVAFEEKKLSIRAVNILEAFAK